MFTSGQIIGIYIFTLFIIYAIIAKCMDAIKHCATAKAQKAFFQYSYSTQNEIINKKEEINNENEKE